MEPVQRNKMTINPINDLSDSSKEDAAATPATPDVKPADTAPVGQPAAASTPAAAIPITPMTSTASTTADDTSSSSSSAAAWHMPDSPASVTSDSASSDSSESSSDDASSADTPSFSAPSVSESKVSVSEPSVDPDPPIMPAAPFVSVSSGGDDLPPSNSPAAGIWPVYPDEIRPVPVVRVLSPIGVEYVFMTIALFSGAVGLASALVSLVNGKFDFAVLSFPVALLVVSLPVFAFFFLRLKKLELENPKLALDPSKRRSTQFTQITAFMVCLFTLVGMVFAILAKLGGQSPISIGKAIADSLCVLAVAGGILAYYWLNEHKS